MNESKIKVCIFLYGFHNGGIEKMFENYFSNMDLSKLDIHIVTYMEPDTNRENIFKNMGITTHRLTQFRAHKIKLKNILEHIKFFKKNKFDVVHCNMPENILPLFSARLLGVKSRFLHSHNDYNAIFHRSNQLVRKLYKLVLKFNALNATKLIACGELAASTAFDKNKDVIILHNAIDIQKFEYNIEKRESIRKQYKLSDNNFVIGHVGRYETDQKNQEFVIELFEKYCKINKFAKLMLVGEGKKRQHYVDLVQSKGMSEKVIFTGAVNNVSDYFQAMDVFCFPSRYEGLGIVVIEAQATGLPCIISKNVPEEVKIFDDVYSLGLDNNIEWLDMLEKISSLKKKDRNNRLSKIAESGYEIKSESIKLLDLYLNCK